MHSVIRFIQHRHSIWFDQRCCHSSHLILWRIGARHAFGDVSVLNIYFNFYYICSFCFHRILVRHIFFSLVFYTELTSLPSFKRQLKNIFIYQILPISLSFLLVICVPCPRSYCSLCHVNLYVLLLLLTVSTGTGDHLRVRVAFAPFWCLINHAG